MLYYYREKKTLQHGSPLFGFSSIRFRATGRHTAMETTATRGLRPVPAVPAESSVSEGELQTLCVRVFLGGRPSAVIIVRTSSSGKLKHQNSNICTPQHIEFLFLTVLTHSIFCGTLHRLAPVCELPKILFFFETPTPRAIYLFRKSQRLLGCGHHRRHTSYQRGHTTILPRDGSRPNDEVEEAVLLRSEALSPAALDDTAAANRGRASAVSLCPKLGAHIYS